MYLFGTFLDDVYILLGSLIIDIEVLFASLQAICSDPFGLVLL
jgi:hypothetical protein